MSHSWKLGPAVAICLLAAGCSEQLHTYETSLFLFVNSTLRTPLLDRFAGLFTEVWNSVIPVACLLVLWAIWQRKKWGVLVALAVVIGLADGSAGVLKRVVDRPRPCRTLAEAQPLLPCGNAASFPSGHATIAFAAAAFLTVYDRKRWWLWGGIATLVAFSRVYVGAHYVLDVAAGALLGGALGYMGAMGSRRLPFCAEADPAS